MDKHCAAKKFIHFRNQYVFGICRLKHVGLIYEYLSFQHGSSMVQMYHSKVAENVQDEVAELFCDPSSELRIVICSSSFSMGEISLPLVLF